MSPTRDNLGFTLVELIVVIALISIVMFSAFPRFQNTFFDSRRTVSRWILTKIPLLKQKAATENHTYTLQVDFDHRQFIITHDAMTPEDVQHAKKNAFKLPEDVGLKNVEYPENHIVSTGIAKINFYLKGYSDRAILHLKAGEGFLSFFIEPFLSEIRSVDANVGYNEK
jgi:general secretion pathway protein H